MKYLGGSFSVLMGGEDYAAGWERTFGKAAPVGDGGVVEALARDAWGGRVLVLPQVAASICHECARDGGFHDNDCRGLIRDRLIFEQLL
jgi:hypothetical protein